MDLVEIYCRKCGGTLERISEEQYKCAHCRSVFYEDHLQREIAMLSSILDTAKQEKLSNLRGLLWTELKKEYTNSEEIISYCKEIKKLYPEDYYANLYAVLNGDSDAEVNEFLDKTNAVEYSEDIPDILSFMFKSLKAANLISVGDLIERAYGSDRGQYEKYMTEFEAEAEKVEQGVYDPSFPRDVFVMYSSADMAKVKSLTSYLEEQGISCFVAARNLQHGRGAVANYQKSLETALDNCKSIVFVSSKNSRSLKCDAIRLEIPYVQKKDFSNAPGELRNRYDTLPDKYKKPRVEYVIDSYTGKNVVEKRTKEFFGTLQWAQSEEAVAERVIDILSGTPAVDEAEIRRQREAEEAEARRKAELEELKHSFEEQLKHQQEELKKVGKTNTAPVVNASPVSAGGANTDALLRRAFMFLEDGDTKSADEYCEKVLDNDPENAEAYLGKLMVELKVKIKENLKHCKEPFGGNNNCQKIMRFGDEALKTELRGYIDFINTRNENTRLEGIYSKATSLMNSAKSESDFKEAAKLFDSVKAYKDSADKAKKCLENAAEEKRKADEAKRIAEEERRRAEEEKKHCDALLAQLKEIYRNGEKNEAKKSDVSRRISALTTEINNLTALKNKWQQIETEISSVNGKIAEKQAEISKYNTEKASLGFFAGKRKKELAEQILAAEREVSILRKKLSDLSKQKQGYASLADVSNTLSGKEANVAEQKKALVDLSEIKDVDGICAELRSCAYGKGILNNFEFLKKLGNPKIGGIIKLGKYKQSGKNENPEDIEWQVLDRQGDKVLVISKYGLDCKQYNETNKDIMWENCMLRKWLNNDFINAAFTAEEKTMIPTVTVSADKNPNYSTNPGNVTQDKMFLLSIAEAKEYFASNEERKCNATEYAGAQGAYTDSSQNCWWWLRSPASHQNCASSVAIFGDVRLYGNLVSNAYGAVRPAMWIDLNA